MEVGYFNILLLYYSHCSLHPCRRPRFRSEISVGCFSGDISARDHEFKVSFNNNYKFRLESAKQLKRLNKLYFYFVYTIISII